MGLRLLAGLALLAVAGCGGGGGESANEKPSPTPDALDKALDEAAAKPDPPDEEGELNALLRERAQLLERGAGKALAATARGAQKARDRRAARRTRPLALEQVRFATGELTTSGKRAKVVGALAYRVRGMRRPFTTPRVIKARKTGDGWVVTSDRPRREPLPWEVTPLRATRTRHVVLLAPPGLAVGDLRSGLERAYREIRRDLPRRDLPPSVLVIAARGHKQAEGYAGRIAQGVVALANVAVEWGPPPALKVSRVLAQRMIVIDSMWRRQPPEMRQSTLVHEMVHTALNPDTSLRTPPWLIEGVAMYVSNDDRRQEAAARAAGLGPTMRLSQISKPDSIFKLGGQRQGGAYAAASAAAYEIVDRRGTKGLFRLYDAFNDSTIRGAPGARTTNRIMRRTIKLSLGELESAIR